jgi:hypothetical protein
MLRWISQPPISTVGKPLAITPPCAVRSPTPAAGFPPIITVAEALAMLSGAPSRRPLQQEAADQHTGPTGPRDRTADVRDRRRKCRCDHRTLMHVVKSCCSSNDCISKLC